jgi:hypothetical protein
LADIGFHSNPARAELLSSIIRTSGRNALLKPPGKIRKMRKNMTPVKKISVCQMNQFFLSIRLMSPGIIKGLSHNRLRFHFICW